MIEQTGPNRNKAGWIGDIRITVGLAVVAVIALVSGSIVAWAQAQTATRGEVAQMLTNVEPPCRRIIGMTMQSHYMETGKPMTRGELYAVVDKMTTCKAINDQLDGIADAVKQQ